MPHCLPNDVFFCHVFELTIFVFAKVLCVHVEVAMIDPHRTDAVVRFSVLWLLQDHF